MLVSDLYDLYLVETNVNSIGIDLGPSGLNVAVYHGPMSVQERCFLRWLLEISKRDKDKGHKIFQ